jgi:hypothetical protein
MAIDKQRLGKHIPEVTLSTIEGYPLLHNGPITRILKKVFSMGSVPRNYKKVQNGVKHGVKRCNRMRIKGVQRR